MNNRSHIECLRGYVESIKAWLKTHDANKLDYVDVTDYEEGCLLDESEVTYYIRKLLHLKDPGPEPIYTYSYDPVHEADNYKRRLRIFIYIFRRISLRSLPLLINCPSATIRVLTKYRLNGLLKAARKRSNAQR